MRYFRYKNTQKNMNNALKEQYLTLTKDEKRIVRKEKIWRKCAGAVTLILLSVCIFLSILLLKMIPYPANKWLVPTVAIGKIIAGFILLIISGVLSFAVAYPLWKKVESFNIPSMRKEIFSKACAHLRDYYGLQEPYILTKCYNSTNEKFKNHDVCIFIVDDELRITTDLVNGFLHGNKDLGCCAFQKDEISISKKRDGKLLIAELGANDTVFLLGYRAKSFIERNFILRKTE